MEPIAPTWTKAAPAVLPVVRRVTEPTAARGRPLLRRRWRGWLDALVVLDHPDRRVFLAPHHLDAWGVAEDAVWARALTNLASLSTSIAVGGPGLFQIQDGYAPSRLLLPGWLAAFRDRVRGEPLAVAPLARLLLVTGSREPALPEVLDLAWRGFREGGGPLSPAPVWCDGAPAPPGDPAVGRQLAAAQRLLQTWTWAEQRELLEDEGVLPPPARVQLLRAGDGDTVTRCRWEAGDALLPHTDRVLIVDGGRQLDLRWDTVASVLGPLTPRGWVPERFLARWPGASRLAALGPDP